MPAHFGPIPSAGLTTRATIREVKSEQQDTHFADVAFRKNAERGQLLPIDHLWICNASLSSWHEVLTMRGELPCIYLCTDHARELGLPWSS
jgi:hypothetical protein